jgi:hypothetical protein
MPQSPEITNQQYQSDLQFGLTAELDVKNNLENEFGSLTQLDKYNPFDFENDEYLIELKSRRINHNQYPTTMVNLSKLKRTENTTKQRVIVFNYMDGLYKWTVDDNYTTGIGGRCDRGLDEYSQMAYIDINNLTLITAQS